MEYRKFLASIRVEINSMINIFASLCSVFVLCDIFVSGTCALVCGNRIKIGRSTNFIFLIVIKYYVTIQVLENLLSIFLWI